MKIQPTAAIAINEPTARPRPLSFTNDLQHSSGEYHRKSGMPLGKTEQRIRGQRRGGNYKMETKRTALLVVFAEQDRRGQNSRPQPALVADRGLRDVHRAHD